MAVVQSVLGPLDGSELGAVLPHEHVLVDFSRGLSDQQPPSPLMAAARESGRRRRVRDLELKMENMGLIRRFPYSVVKNLVMDDPDQLSPELQLYKSTGGGTICELSVVGMRCNPHRPEQLAKMSHDTGVNIIHATGFYIESFLPEWARAMSVREMADYMMGEIQHGVGESGVRCGVMYIGCSWPLKETERRALQAAALTQVETGVAMVICPGRNIQAPFDIHDLLTSCGADSTHISMSHMDRTYIGAHARPRLLELAGRGCYLNHSLFSKECSHYQYYNETVDLLSDAQRLQQIKSLIEAGFEDRVLMSHDIVTKHELVQYGGSGYGHIVEHILPKMTERGFSQEDIDRIVRENPKNFLCNAI